MSTKPIVMQEPMPTGELGSFSFFDLSKKSSRDMHLSVSLPTEDHSADFIAVAGGHDDHGNTTPFQIHSSVLDSVFSNSLDEHDQLQDHTPMFDDLDFVLDGTKVNSKDDWVALFSNEDHETGPVEEEEDLLAGIPKEELAESSIFVKMEEEAKIPKAAKRSFSEVEPIQQQLITPNPSSTLPTPLLDAVKPESNKVDRLGCVSYSKKQRTQPLQPIDTKTSDPVLMKRAKNTEAARRSRARKMERMTQLENKVEELMKEKESLEGEVSRLRAMLKAQGITNF